MYAAVIGGGGAIEGCDVVGAAYYTAVERPIVRAVTIRLLLQGLVVLQRNAIRTTNESTMKRLQ